MKRTNLTKLPTRRAVVTGGAGFLGSHLCARLLQEGFSVVALDNLVTGNLQNLELLRGRDAFKFIRHDVTAPIDLETDCIFNFACCAVPQRYRRDPEKAVRTCSEGAVNLLHQARRNGARIVQASTGDVCGGHEARPQRESYRGNVSPIGPRACCDEGMRCAEALFFDHHRAHGVEIKVARIYSTYGPRMRLDDDRVVSNFIVRALRNEPLPIHGDGGQTHSLCYVDDLMDGILRLMRSPATLTGPVDLGNPVEVTVLQLAERILELTGSRSTLARRPMPLDAPTRRRPDITLAHDALGWEPRIPLDEGLKRTIAYFEQALANDVPARERSVSRA